MIFSNNNIIKGELINDPEHDFYKSFDIYYHNFYWENKDTPPN